MFCKFVIIAPPECAFGYAAAREAVRRALEFPLPSIPDRDNVGYYVYPGKQDVVAGEWYCRALQSAPQAAVFVDDWSHGLAILIDYCQRVLGLRRDVTVLPWYPESLIGAEPLEQERAISSHARFLDLWLPPAEGEKGLARIAAYVAKEAANGRPVFLTTDEFPLNALVAELRRRGFALRREGLLLHVIAIGEASHVNYRSPG